MSKDKKEKKANVVMDPFQQCSHSKGRIGTLIMLIYMVAILALAALLSSRIGFVFEIPQVKTASNYIIPALFGSLTLGLFSSSSYGDKVLKGGRKALLLL